MNKHLLLAPLLIAACVDQGAVDDPRDESFLGDGGKGDAFGITDDSPEGFGILQLVNNGSWREIKDAGLGDEAFREFWVHRNGRDNQTWSDDDDLFNDLTELDDVPYIGQTAFTKLLAYATDHGYIAPNALDSSSCTGAPISLARLQDVTQNGTALLPTGSTWIRTRACNGALGCGAWSEPHKLGRPYDNTLKLAVITNDDIHFTAGHYSIVSRPQRAGYNLDEYRLYRWSFKMNADPFELLDDTMSGRFDYSYGSNVTSSGVIQNTELTFTDSCMRITGRVPPAQPVGTEAEVAFLVEY